MGFRRGAGQLCSQIHLSYLSTCSTRTSTKKETVMKSQCTRPPTKPRKEVIRTLKTLMTVTSVSGVLLAGILATSAPASASSYLGGVDMQRACDTQNPAMGLRAVVKDQHNAYSWRCVSPWGYSVGIDVNRECVTQYGGGAYAGLWNWQNPYSWFCQR